VSRYIYEIWDAQTRNLLMTTTSRRTATAWVDTRVPAERQRDIFIMRTGVHDDDVLQIWVKKDSETRQPEPVA
jgi:hypothetical protein